MEVVVLSDDTINTMVNLIRNYSEQIRTKTPIEHEYQHIIC